jgi:hypothetical protein
MSRAASILSSLPVLFLCSLAGCASPTKSERPTMNALNATAKIKAMLSAESQPAPMKKVALLDGLASAEVESNATPRPECEQTDGGDRTCAFQMDLGKDTADSEVSMSCNVTTAFMPFGPLVHVVMDKYSLGELPAITTKAVGEGVATSFVVDAMREDQQHVLIATLKVATFYSKGYVARCVDINAGNREAFARVTNHFFETLKLAPNPRHQTLFTAGYTVRVGETTNGFRVSMITKQGDGFSEQGTEFRIHTDGKTLNVSDVAHVVDRNEKGGVEKMQYLVWSDGQGPAVLSARPSEDKKFRLKFEAGQMTNGLESTLKAPLNTELWAAAELRDVAGGSAPSYRYAFVDLIDRDPSFNYVTLTRASQGVLLEDVEETSNKDKKAKGSTKDELHIDARGLVTKEVSSASVTELVSTWGELPELARSKKDGGKAKGKRK